MGMGSCVGNCSLYLRMLKDGVGRTKPQKEIGKRKLGCAFLTNKIRNSTHRFYISFPSYPQSEELLSVEQRSWRETGTSIFT
jgi:hypothetical protein